MSMFTTSSNWLRRIRRPIDFHDAQRCGSGAPGSRSNVGKDAVGNRVHPLLMVDMVVVPPLQVLGLKPCTLGNPGEHARTDLFRVVEGKDEGRPSGA